jgi:hypothetical protein
LQEGRDLQKAINQRYRCFDKAVGNLRRRVEIALEGENVYFITYTIAPKYENRSQKYIHRKIKEALAGASNWVLNPDIGDNTNRLHFHALAAFDYPLDYQQYNTLYPYGATKILKIHKKNDKAIGNYIAKVQNHAIKDTALKISYSRRKR